MTVPDSDRVVACAICVPAAATESRIHAEAGLRTFADPAVDHYWHRSRPKSPSLVEQRSTV
jgi:hypothetical protein